MNCREAEHEIFAERDGALDNDRRAALAKHVAECASCRASRERFAAAVDTWQASAETVRVPDAELEWQKVRREIRGGAGTKSVLAGARLGWLALPLAAAAALALTFFVDPATPDRGATDGRNPQVARATIEASVENASPLVFVDEKSGWVFVWAAGDPKQI